MAAAADQHTRRLVSFFMPWLRRLFAHPGELSVAEHFAADAQRLVLVALGPEALARVQVVPTAVTDLTTFLYTQPAVTALPGQFPRCLSQLIGVATSLGQDLEGDGHSDFHGGLWVQLHRADLLMRFCGQT